MTTSTVDRAWLHRFARLTRLATLSTVSIANTCILTTRIGLSVLERAGIKAIAQPVFVAVYNREGYRLTQEQVPVSQWPDNAHSIGVDQSNLFKGDGGWNGHLVLVLRIPGQPRTLIDLTADQFDRPAKGINVSGPVFMDIATAAPWTPRDPLFSIDREDKEILLSYRPMPPKHPAANTWRNSPDWKVPEDRLTAYTDSILAKIDEFDG